MKQTYNFSTKQLGIIIIVVSMALLFVLASFTIKLYDINTTQCSCLAGSCPMGGNLPIEVYIGVTVVLILISIGSFLILKTKQAEMIGLDNKEKIKKITKTLKVDEKKVFETIIESDGAVFQSELVEKTGFSKVRVTRILDKLEGKGIIERRRRGMTNIVILKH